jgi:hypothetical protein
MEGIGSLNVLPRCCVVASDLHSRGGKVGVIGEERDGFLER